MSVVLFDGLDEIFDETLRGNIVAEIINFARDYASTKIIVTTRVVGYAVGSPNPELFRAAGFRQLTLQDRNDQEIREFISKWYQASIPDAAEREELAERLTGDIANSRSIRELAGNPLLLTMMALLNRRKRLPRERLKLYEACAELLVEGWDAARHLEKSSYLTHDDKIEILQRIAYEMQHERQGLGGNMISERRLMEILIAALRDRSVANPGLAAKKIVSALAERDFMLCFVGDEQFSFVHRTFLEYFCAKEYRGHLENGDGASEVLDLFRKRWPDDAWHEVLRLVCAMVGPDLARALASEILSTGPGRSRWQAIFLAAECLGEVRQVGKVEAERRKAHLELCRLLDFRGDNTDTNIRIRSGAVERLARFWPAEEATKAALLEAAGNQFWRVRFTAVEELVRQWHDATTLKWLFESAVGPNWAVRMAAVHGLVQGWPDETTRRFLVDQLNSHNRHFSFHTAIEELSRRWPTETTREWLTEIAVRHHRAEAQSNALREVANRWPDEETRALLLWRVSNADDEGAQAAAIQLAHHWPDEPTRKNLIELATHDDKPRVRDAALSGLAWGWLGRDVRDLIVDRLKDPRRARARSRLIEALAYRWPDERTKQKLVELATGDANVSMRRAAVSHLAEQWPEEEVRLLVQRVSATDKSGDVRRFALGDLAEHWPTEETKEFLLERSSGDEERDVQEAALEELLNRWPDDPRVQSLRRSDGV
jgi:hypothetical protein